jgi:hypothetical protein
MGRPQAAHGGGPVGGGGDVEAFGEKCFGLEGAEQGLDFGVVGDFLADQVETRLPGFHVGETHCGEPLVCFATERKARDNCSTAGRNSQCHPGNGLARANALPT